MAATKETAGTEGRPHRRNSRDWPRRSRECDPYMGGNQAGIGMSGEFGRLPFLRQRVGRDTGNAGEDIGPCGNYKPGRRQEGFPKIDRGRGWGPWESCSYGSQGVYMEDFP